MPIEQLYRTIEQSEDWTITDTESVLLQNIAIHNYILQLTDLNYIYINKKSPLHDNRKTNNAAAQWRTANICRCTKRSKNNCHFKNIKVRTFSLSKNMWQFPYNKASCSNILIDVQNRKHLTEKANCIFAEARSISMDAEAVKKNSVR